MNNKSSGQFFIGSLVIFIVLFGVVLVVLDNMEEVAKNVTAPESMEPEAVEERIKPIAQVEIGEPPAVEAPAADAAETGGAGSSGEQVFSSVCIACHATNGLPTAPSLGNAKEWAPRIEKGMDTLYQHAINGFNTMPARGGNANLTDEEVQAAVDYMVSQSQ